MTNSLDTAAYTEKKAPSKRFTARRELRMTLLLALVLSWASLVREIDKSGTLSEFMCFETLMELGSSR